MLSGPPASSPPTDTPLALWLRAMLWAALLVPATGFVIAAGWGYERALKDAERDVAHASSLALRHAERTLAVVADLAARADVASAGDDEAVRAHEAALHQRLADMVIGLRMVANLNVWDAAGRPIARSDLFPVDPRASVGDRAYFAAHREAGLPMGVSEVLTGRQTGLRLVNATVRRSSPDGSFRGVVAVSMAPGFFSDYYRSLASEQPNLAHFALVRSDGALLARWPLAPDARSDALADSPVLQRVAAGEIAGSLVLSADANGAARLVSFRRVGDYPVYVMASISSAATLAGWYRFMGLLAAVLVPVTAGLFYVTWVALKKTRREQAMQIALNEEIGRRANTQKLETLAQLTGGVAHDFNNLLSIISNSLHVHKRLHPELSHERQLEAMARAIKSGVRLTRQLLSFSRKQALRPERVRLQDWLPATRDLVQGSLAPQVTLVFHVDADTRPVTVDLAELELAIINTALNAQHAMPHGGTLRITARNAAPVLGQDVPMVVVSVSDDGEGIAPELLPRVFEPFFTTKAMGKGSGLGLAQVHGLCAQAGGYATVDSVLGHGTSISMCFPAATAAVAAPEPVPGEPPAAQPLLGQLLLVEDNHDVAVATETVLKSAGLGVVTVPHADAALAHLATAARQPDVVLSDISMPGSMNGIGLAFALRRQRPELPVLLTTGYAEQLHEAVVGGFRVLPKPAAPEDLLAELRRLLGLERSGEQRDRATG